MTCSIQFQTDIDSKCILWHTYAPTHISLSICVDSLIFIRKKLHILSLKYRMWYRVWNGYSQHGKYLIFLLIYSRCIIAFQVHMYVCTYCYRLFLLNKTYNYASYYTTIRAGNSCAGCLVKTYILNDLFVEICTY